MKRVVMGIVDHPRHADITVRQLVASGFAPSDVSVLFPDRHGAHDFAFVARTKAPEGAIAGVAFGGMLGAMTGLALALTGIAAAPGAFGLLLVALATAAVTALVLGLVGAAIGALTPEIEARYFEGKVRAGTILVGVHARGRRQQRIAREALRAVAASAVRTTTEAPLPA